MLWMADWGHQWFKNQIFNGTPSRPLPAQFLPISYHSLNANGWSIPPSVTPGAVKGQGVGQSLLMSKITLIKPCLFCSVQLFLTLENSFPGSPRPQSSLFFAPPTKSDYSLPFSPYPPWKCPRPPSSATAFRFHSRNQSLSHSTNIHQEFILLKVPSRCYNNNKAILFYINFGGITVIIHVHRAFGKCKKRKRKKPCCFDVFVSTYFSLYKMHVFKKLSSPLNNALWTSPHHQTSFCTM